MSDAGPAGAPGKVLPAEPRPNRRAITVSAALWAVGAAEVLLAYVALRSRLPAQVAWHFGLTGAPDGYGSPTDLLGLGLAEVSLVSVTFLAFVWWAGRSPPLARQFRGGLEPVLLSIQGVLVVVIFPLVADLLFASGAGVLPVSGAALGLLLSGVGIVSAVALILALLRQGRRWEGRSPPLAAGQAPFRAFLAVGGPIGLVCSACGKRFQLSGVPLLAPHVGMGRVGSLYLRCPLCGERGWDEVLGPLTA